LNDVLEEVIVIGHRLQPGPSGSTITEKLFTGGIQLVDGFTTLHAEHPTLASIAFEAGRGVMTGGPVKTLLTKLAKTAFDGTVSQVGGYLSNKAQNAAAEFVTDLGISTQLNIAGNNVSVTPGMFGQGAGQLAGGIVDTIFDGGVKQVVDRENHVRDVVHNRRSEYPRTVRPSTRDAVLAEHRNAQGQIAHPRTGEVIPDSEVTLEHTPSIVEDITTMVTIKRASNVLMILMIKAN
jgi:hypothetical protein